MTNQPPVLSRRGPVPGLATTFAVLCVLGAVVAVFVVFLQPRTSTSTIVIAANRLVSTAIEPYCDQRHAFCITQPSPGEFEALVPLDTHPVFRANGCSLSWHPHSVAVVVNGVPDSPVEPGLFISGCSGAKFDIAGAWQFGPAARAMDHLPLNVRADGSVEVSLAPVIAGRPLGAVGGTTPRP